MNLSKAGGFLLGALLLAGLILPGAQAQQINAGAGQSLQISDSTVPSPIVGVTASGSGATVTGTNAVVQWNRNGSVISASGGGTVNLTGGSVTNNGPAGTSSNVIGLAAGSNGAINLWDLSVTVNAAGTGVKSPKALAIESSASNASIFASNVDITVSGSTISSEAGAAVRSLSSTGTITLTNNSTVNASGPYVYGLFAGAGGRISSNGTVISTTGSSSLAVYSNAANAGAAHITLNGGSITTSGLNAHGLYGAKQSNTSAAVRARITGTNVSVETNGAGAIPVFADRGSEISLSGGSVKSTGAGTPAIFAQAVNGATSGPASVATDGTTIVATGHAASGVIANAGGSATIQSGTISTAGYEGVAMVATGSGSKITANNVTVETDLRAAHGAYATAGGEIEVNGGSITVEGGQFGSTAPGYTYGLSADSNGKITATGVTITTGNDWSYGVSAGGLNKLGGEVAVSGGTVTTTGNRAHAISAVGYGGVITSSANVVTSGSSANGAQAYSNSPTDTGVVNLTGGLITTTGITSHGIAAVGEGAQVNSVANVVTQGVGSYGAVADRRGIVNLNGGNISVGNVISAGLAVVDGGTINAENVKVSAAGDAIWANFERDLAGEVATINLGPGSNVSSGTATNTLLRVNRSPAFSNSQTGIVSLNLTSGAVAAGDIFDIGEKTTGYLDINIGAGAQLTANQVQGYRNFTVDGQLLGVGTIGVTSGQSLIGTGYVNHNVTVDGGTLSPSLVVKGKVTLVGQEVEVPTIVTGTTYVVDSGKELVTDTVESGAVVDATQGTANIQTVQDGATVEVGNWGATIQTVNGGTINANQGVVNVTNLNAGEITQGTIVVNNSGATASGGQFIVGEDATIGGNGTVGAHATISGKLNPGNSPGLLHFADGLTLEDSTTTTMEIGGEEAGISFDQIDVTGPLIYDGILSIDVVDGFEFLIGDTFQLFTFIPGQESGDFDSIVFSLSGIEGDFNASTGILEITGVPEPGTVTLIGLAALACLARRHRCERTA